MPFGQCPVCGANYHLNVNLPVGEWYARHWPGIAVGEPVRAKCARCSVDLRPGHRVSIRSVPLELEGRVEVGACGVVTAIKPIPPAFVVELEGSAARIGRFRREELLYIIGQ